MASKLECYNEALSAIKNFTQDELQDYVKRVLARSKEYDNLGSQASIERAMSEINNESLRSLYEDVTTKARNIQKFEEVSKMFREGKFDMRGFLARRGDVKGKTVVSSIHAAQESLVQFMFDDSISEADKEYLSNGNHDDDIASALDGIPVKDASAKKLADKINKYIEERNSRLINSTAMNFDEINEDRRFRAIHVARKLINGGKSLINAALSKEKVSLKENKTIWMQTIRKYLDVQKTFSKTKAVDEQGNINDGEVNRILSTIYDNITTGKSNIFTKSTVINDAEAIERKSHMFFVFKDWRSLLEYNKIYGQGNIYAALMRDITSSANKVGAARFLGSNPDQMYAALRKVQVENDIENDKPKMSQWWSNTDVYYKTIMKSGLNDTDSTLSNVVGLLKTATTIGRLGFTITADCLSDIAYQSAFAKRVGASGYWKAWAYQTMHLLNLLKSDDRIRYANMMKMNCDAHLGYIGRFAEASNFNEVLSKMSSGFFKFNLLHYFDEGSKIGGITLIGKALSHASKMPLDKIADENPELHSFISKFLDKNEWDLVRKNNQKGLFTTDNASTLSDSDLKEYRDKAGIETPLFELRNDLYRNIHSMFDVTSENMVLQPTVFEKAFLTRGLQGTNAGQILSLFTQFKMYTMGYIDRVLVQGLKDSDTFQKKLQWATTLMIGSLPLSTAAYMFKQFEMGKSVQLPIPGVTHDWDSMNLPDREQYILSMVQPSLGIVNGFLDPHNQNASILWSLLGSPSTKFIGSTLASAGALLVGNTKASENNLRRAADYLLPLQTTPFISPLINDALDQKPQLLPGQQQLYGA